ncbi:cytochrome P450 [Favolaschia claudopus]|uniref:Cytochrome P450 n=1 Tax=Favolaschia claudopus TaxID=2862362 RepID=A0AAV9ZML9_9AGAR
MANLSGWESVLSSARYGSRSLVIGQKWRTSILRLEYQANMFLKRVLSNPEGFDMATRKTAGAVVLKVTYGYVVKEDGNDSLVDLADKALLEFSEITPARRLSCGSHSSLFPGAGFKRRAERYRKSIEEMAQIPLEYVQSQMSEQTAAQSFTSDLLKDGDVSPNTLEEIKWSAASFYGAGADTTVSVVMAYFLAAAKYPCIQRAAQAEMDTVVGTKRLPTFEDRASLPYVEAVCKELLRSTTPRNGRRYI